MSVPMTIRRAAKTVLPRSALALWRKRRRPARVDWCRVVMDRECDRFVDKLDVRSMKCLEISGEGSRWVARPWASYEVTSYPAYDICSDPLNGQWDIIIAEQVLEHTRDPERAVGNILLMLRAGGIALITTPFLIKFHPYPGDFYRWTPEGMREMLLRAGFTAVITDAWGNRKCMIADMTNDMRWTPYSPWRHSLKNERRFAVSVWAFAHKPVSAS
jgi:hypothetical protein